MSLSHRSARTRAAAVLTAAATVAGGAALLGPGTSSASSHREAPYISTDPAVDNTDTYAFVSPDDPNSVSLIANWAPFSEPAGGPNFFPWATDAAYDINIDNDGDAKPDIIYRWTFKDIDLRGAQERGKVDGTFLYADGPVTSLDDPNLLFKQTYTLEAIVENGTAAPTSTILVNNGPVAPSNVGQATIPDYIELRRQAVVDAVGGGKSYVGQADDSFYLDLRVFDLLYGGDLSETGYDTLSGYNVNTVALKLPKALLTANQNPEANPVIGVWSTTSRYQTRVFKDTNAAPTTSQSVSSDAVNAPNSNDASTSKLVQISRLGNPLVNEAVVPAQLKDFFNRSTPDNDAQFLGKVQDPEIPQLIEAIYKIGNPNKIAGFEERPDLVATFLTGFSKKNADGTQPGTGPLTKGSVAADLNSLSLNAVSPEPAPAEYLRLNVNVPPTQINDPKYSRLGVVGGDLAGFPNGRRLGDDVIDVALQVLEGKLIPGHNAGIDGLGDGVSDNDMKFDAAFPYISAPHTGSDPRKGQDQVKFEQVFTSANGVVSTHIKNISPAIPGGLVQLYRVNPDGSLTGFGTSRLNEAGTATIVRQFRAPIGSRLTLNYRVFPKRTSPAGVQRGLPTTFTVR